MTERDTKLTGLLPQRADSMRSGPRARMGPPVVTQSSPRGHLLPIAITGETLL